MTCKQRVEAAARGLQHRDQQMLRPDLVAAEISCLFLCQHHGDPRGATEPFEHWSTPPVVLLMHGLTAHAQRLGDRLPAPALLTRVGNMQSLELFL